MEQNNYLLEIKDLIINFYTEEGIVTAVDGISYKLRSGEVLGIVGESGCGKSVSALSLLRLIPTPPGKIESGNIFFQGTDLLTISERQMQNIRGNDISMIFQEPMTSLNPVFTIGEQISEVIRLHQKINKRKSLSKVVEMLKLVGIPRAEEIIHEYPHQLSGGMRQRAMIAMSLSCNPKLLIADEPTTALDVTIQAQILELMKNLRKSINSSIIFITHDLGVIAEISEYVLVMYAGKIVEEADVYSLFKKPLHPYTRGLLNSKPIIGSGKKKLDFIPGVVPNMLDDIKGCNFHPRCRHVMEICRKKEPKLHEAHPKQKVSCFLYTESGR
jgi:peptide/nickel transport system ATP-binding protein